MLAVTFGVYVAAGVLVLLAVANMLLAWQDVAREIKADDWTKEGGLQR